MAGYVIAQDEVTDPGVASYREIVPAIIKQFGGRFLVRGSKAETLEGDWELSRLIIVGFASVERAKAGGPRRSTPRRRCASAPGTRS